MKLTDVTQGWSKLTARQPGIFPKALTGPVPSALVKGVLGAGAGYLAAPVISYFNEDIDEERLRRVLTIGGGLAGIGSSALDLASTPKGKFFDPWPFAQAKFEKANAHSHSSTQIQAEGALKDKVLAFASKIPDADLADDGRTSDPHVTVLYGLHDDEPDNARKSLESAGTGTLRLGKISVFDTNPDFDVLKVDVEGDHLHELHELVAKLPHKNTHPVYNPHLTLAYVKKGRGKDYIGDASFEGQTIDYKDVTFSSRTGTRTRINLGTRSNMQKAASQTDVDLPELFGPMSPARFDPVSAAHVIARDPMLSPAQQGLAFQMLLDASASRQGGLISTRDLVNAGIGAGLGYLGGNLVGRVMGSVFGLPPGVKTTAARIGAIGGLLNATGILG
jgi:2'-5' RNA ligase